MQVLPVTAIKPARQVTTKYGDRVVLDVRLPDGSEDSVWDKAGSPLQGYTAGQSLYVQRKEKGGLALVEIQGAAPAADKPLGFQLPPAQAQQPKGKAPLDLSDEQRRSMAADAELCTKIYAHCYALARASMPSDAPPEAVQACASSVWIALSRRHGLQ